MKHSLAASLVLAVLLGLASLSCGTTPNNNGGIDASATCVPLTCDGQGYGCGPLDDGCGNSLDCGSCTSPATCGGAGTANQCGTCGQSEDVSVFCNRYHRNCGPLTANNLCKAPRTENCGSCTTAGDTCGGGGIDGQCGNPNGCQAQTVWAFCQSYSATCGSVTGADKNCPANTRTEQCGTCTTGQSCVNNSCLAATDGGTSSGHDAATTAGLDAQQPAGLDADTTLPGEDASTEPPDADWVPPQGYDAGSCAGTSEKAQLMPLDIFIMLDQSGSMSDTVTGGGTKWSAVTGALNSFLKQPSTGISVGIQYFGIPPTGTACTVAYCMSNSDCTPASACGTCDLTSFSCTNGSSGGDSCTPSDYAKADVEITNNDSQAATTAIAASIAKHSPSTATPTQPALAGAIQHAKAWAQSHLGHVVIDIMATDGEPSECSPMDVQCGTGITSCITTTAAAGVSGSPKILSFIIGIDDGSGNVSDLNALAKAGGTDCATGTCANGSVCAMNNNNCNCDASGKNPACMVSTSGNVNQQFLAALNSIRGAALGCTYQIPAPQTGQIDYTKVNVQYTPGGSGTAQTIGQVSGASTCPSSGYGWYYDNPTTPSQIILCASTCSVVQADTSGEVDVVVGCETKHCPPTQSCFL